ncbi:3-oxo-5-alpha-steroid 4-dehydrogenase family protein [Quillaja saponaria]|uniref:3-oxo-5-alpha-steroid 4-dehydrogenase family protein n=1 Tax=Quillaja saponaria TaxID=32244 RepID=A0AAD7VGN6_QUISA|nr:3-oxo-5-alpha-steroid 4-dehydrogenase family protein [Quillaja saponaria]
MMLSSISILKKFLFPASLFIWVFSIITLISLANLGFSEIKGNHMLYSKFWNVNSYHQVSDSKHNEQKKRRRRLSSKTGMLFGYTPAFLACVASFWIFPHQGSRFLLLKSALTLHFFKRIFEVLFIHKYSGSLSLGTGISISLSYFIVTVTMIYSQHLTKGIPEPPIDLKCPAGIILFLTGIIGNFYHHYLLSKLRRGMGDQKEYKIPKGGFFNLVVCPHYFFEIIDFFGVSFISQTLFSLCFTIGSAFFLMGRSYATRRWYLSRFEDFPKHVKALIPFVF